MEFYSLNGKVSGLSAKVAILHGLASDGGLFMPSHIPKLRTEVLTNLSRLSLAQIGLEVAKLFLGDEVPQRVLEDICKDAFNFPCPLTEIEDRTFVLELFHGPTLAFKDFGARFMSRLVSYFLSLEQKDATVLVATSGDTGSAVAHGFFKVPGTRVVLLYPKGMVSKLQEQQLTTLGENITALQVEGTFDDCQSLVKQAFVDYEIRSRRCLISANSINFARLLPQSTYYIKAFAELASRFNSINFSVPSGNFGNITAGVLAKKMGVPINSFIASVNQNDSFVRYLNSGTLEPRKSISTLSNAMDVGNPSNFVRLLKLFSNDSTSLKREVSGFSFSDQETKDTICKVHKKTGYVLDPHTAVGYLGLKAQNSSGAQVVLATAHPAKFKSIVEDAIGKKIALPSALAECQDKKQFVRQIPASFATLKALLIDL